MKRMAWFLIVALLFTFCFVPAGASVEMPADYNAALALRTLQWATQRRILCSGAEQMQMDETGDGVINAIDALAILRIAVGKQQAVLAQEYCPQVIESGVCTTYEQKEDWNIESVETFICQNKEEYGRAKGYAEGSKRLEESFFQDHTVMVVVDCTPRTTVPAIERVYAKGNRLVAEITFTEQTVLEETGFMFVLALPKLPKAEIGSAVFTVPESRQTPFLNGIDRISERDFKLPNEVSGSFIEQEIITSRQELEDYLADTRIGFYNQTQQQLWWEYWCQRILPIMCQRLTEGFYDRYITVIVRRCGPVGGSGCYHLDGIEKDGTILLDWISWARPGADVATPADDLILVDIPITEDMPETYHFVWSA